jgi:hypothetical protein
MTQPLHTDVDLDEVLVEARTLLRELALLLLLSHDSLLGCCHSGTELVDLLLGLGAGLALLG